MNGLRFRAFFIVFFIFLFSILKSCLYSASEVLKA